MMGLMSSPRPPTSPGRIFAVACCVAVTVLITIQATVLDFRPTFTNPGSLPTYRYAHSDANVSHQDADSFAEEDHDSAEAEVEESPVQEMLASEPDVSDLLAELYAPLVPGFDEQFWPAGQDDTLFAPGRSTFREPLGSDVVIIDVDNRIGEKTMVGRPSGFDYDKIDHTSAAIMNHYLYAKIHGYDFQVIKPDYELKGLHPTWYKVGGIKEALKTHKYVVFLDGDAIFRNLELPLEWLMNYWEIDENTALAGADVPHELKNPHGRQWDKDFKYPKINTGFLIVQQTNVTDDMMDAWLDCHTGKEYPGCEHFKEDFPHEQGALADFIRLDPRFEEHIMALPCDDADGGPANPHCKGIFIEHLWNLLGDHYKHVLFKAQVPKYVAAHLAHGIFEMLNSNLMKENKKVLNVLTERPTASPPKPTTWPQTLKNSPSPTTTKKHRTRPTVSKADNNDET